MATVLTIPTYDGSGQTVHPDVIKVGSTYWMAITPYPNDDDTKENPSILTSSDRTTWAVPGGLTNPVVAAPADGINSDPDLVHDGSTFYLFYRENTPYSTKLNEKIYVRSSADGITWGAATQLLSGTSLKQFLSPTVVKDGSTWRMWCIDANVSPNVLQMRTASSPTGPWSAPVTCTIAVPSGKDIWHIDVVADGGRFVASVDYCDENTSGTAAYLAFASSATGTNWVLGDTTIDPADPIERVYRGSVLLEDDEVKLWYGDRRGSDGFWRTLYDEYDLDIFPITFEPAGVGAEAGFQAGLTFEVSADVTLFPHSFGAEAGFQAGVSFRSVGQRRLMLTGAGIETPEMAPLGTVGQMVVVTADGYGHADGGATPATTVEAETTWGITPAVGTSSDYAKGDHTHGTPEEPAGGGIGPLLLASDHAVPIEFEDILQASDGSDFLYASEP